MKTHQQSRTRFYKIWKGIRTRCLNPHFRYFKDYGGRGIGICQRWSRFEEFRRDLASSYYRHCRRHGESDTTIERINNDAGYQLGNVRWATRAEQSVNRRMQKLTREKVAEIRSRYHYGNGRELAKEFGVSPAVISEIVNRRRNYGNC